MKGRETVVYCIVPMGLVRLEETLLEHFRDDPAVEIVVERRRRERRGRLRRHSNGAIPDDPSNRRSIRNEDGRRVADRRADTRPVDPRELPSSVRDYANQIQFCERIAPDPRRLRAIEADRLVLRVQSGDQDAFDDLYRCHLRSVYDYVRRQLRDPHEAEDVTQEVFMSVLEALPGYAVDRPEAFQGWLMRITRNTTVDTLRKRGRCTPHNDDQLERALSRESEVNDDTLRVLSQLSERTVRAFVKDLAEPLREVIFMRYHLDYSFGEIAKRMHRTEKGVRRLHERAVEDLRMKMAAAGYTSASQFRVPTIGRLRRPPVLAARRFSLGPPGSSQGISGTRPGLSHRQL